MLTQHHKSSSSLFPAELVRETKRQAGRSAEANSISVVAEAHHLSQLVYVLPPARVKAIFPRELAANGFAPLETIGAEGSRCSLSVISYLDQPSGLLNSARAVGFEQTFYRLLLTRSGQPFQWLFHTTAGSLGAVSARHLWALPWHLGAMEFQLGYDITNHLYRTYRLHSQSEFINAAWEFEDTGEVIGSVGEHMLPSLSLQPTINDCFVRRAGGIGLRQTRFRLLEANRGRVRQARCDLLERLGLLTRAELLNPACVLLSRVASFELAAPIVLPTSESFTFPMLKAA